MVKNLKILNYGLFMAFKKYQNDETGVRTENLLKLKLKTKLCRSKINYSTFMANIKD